MVFEFQILGLLVIFLLVCIYYSKERSLSKEGKLFKVILLSSYVLQLLYISTFVAYRGDSFLGVFSKLYLFFVSFVFLMVMGYFWLVGFKSRYVSKQTKYFELVRKSYVGLGILNCLVIFVLGWLDIYFCGNVLLGAGVDFVFGIWAFSLILEFVCLLIYKRDILPKKWFCLLGGWGISFVSLILSFRYREVGFVNSSLILLVLFMYLTLENYWLRENERLRLERDYAVSNNLEKSVFLTNMSHEIRTPLNTIDGFSQVIMESDDIDSVREDAMDIRMASKDLVDIINGIIDISIIESGKLEILKENYNVYDMFDNVISIVNSKIKDKNVEFVCSIDKNIPKVLYGDSVRIEQVLLNLLTNAIKFTKKGSITLKVESVKAVSMCRLKISVIDTGIGIREENLNKVFGGLEERDGKASEGYSLGLVVSKQLLDLMDGKIDVESKYGEGSSFVVTIDQKIGNDMKETKEIKKIVVKPFDCKGKKILIVDDNKLNIKVVSKMLAPYNISIREAYSGQECLDILDNDNEFDLIFMDDLMPKMSGTETLEILRKIERVDGYSIPVVVLTANAISGMREKYLKAGFDDYLAKPIDRTELYRILKRFLKNTKGDDK